MHRLCVEAHRISVSFINSFVYFITKQWFARFMVLPEFGVIKICPNLVLWRKVIRRKGEDRGLLKKQWKSRRHRWCIERRSLFANSISNLYTKRLSQKVIKNLYATPLLLYVPSAPPWHCVYLRSLSDSVCLLYKSFSLSLHISEEPDLLTPNL